MAHTALKQAETKAGPEYGPAMSPAIFAKKWLSKFHDLCYYDDIRADVKVTLHPLVWKCRMAELGMWHIWTFHKQATAHSLTRTDYPAEPELSMSPKAPYHVQKAASVAKVNPFEAAGREVYNVDAHLWILRKCKYGERTLGLRWQELPLSLRQSMNELFEKVAEAEEAGWWPLNEAKRKHIMEEFTRQYKAGVRPWPFPPG
ncbi:hypothetical protein PRZ48_013546 [Zasmidium cellare]|uniref:Uncharacterized protein n=1 Tax=Zasmidium cellare TaxID=395010 RepID=A0ABR0E1A7_ZASCE|nr:hypothetical protein PRZ48_013546 [Zasmidium cellare]